MKKIILLYWNIMMKKFLLPISIAVMLFSACGSDSSNDSGVAVNPPADDPQTPPIETPVNPASSATVGDDPNSQPIESSASLEISSASEMPLDTSFVPEGDTSSISGITGNDMPFEILTEEIEKDRQYVAASAITDYETVQSVYESLEEGDKVAFVIRHGRRESGVGVESKLTEAGIEQSQRLGGFLASSEAFSYGHTDFVRTRSTAINIAYGRGEDTTSFQSVITNRLVASTYIKDMELFEQYKKDSTASINEGEVYSQWAFDGLLTSAFYDLEARAVQTIVQGIIPNMSETNRVNIFISHDMFLMPLMIYVSDRKIDRLRYHVSKKGVYYLDGVAVVIKANGERRYHVVNGIEFGT